MLNLTLEDLLVTFSRDCRHQPNVPRDGTSHNQMWMKLSIFGLFPNFLPNGTSEDCFRCLFLGLFYFGIFIGILRGLLTNLSHE